MANKINIVISAEDKASKPIRGVADEMDGASGKSEKFSQALSGLGKVAAIASAAVGTAGLAGAVFGLKQGFEFNSQVEQAQTKLMAFMKDGDKVAKTLSWVKTEAAGTQFSFTDLADAAANLTPVANSSGHSLEDLVRQAEILAALNPEQGLGGAMFSLREALSGDWMSIMDRFNIPRTRINQLKAEGVPAMEIISRTLQEMGIDYSLVAKQGQTVSARWEQITDKLRMMAGQATKPIFDRVSQELGILGGFDYTGLGNNLAGIVSGAITAFDEFIPKAVELGRQVGDYLGPKMQGLWSVVAEKLIPALGRLWKEVLEPLMPVIGTTLVVALGAAADLSGIFLGAISGLLDFLSANQWIIWGAVGAFAAFKGALAIEEGKKVFSEAMDIIHGKIDGASGKLNGLNTNLGSIGWAAAGTAASIALQIIIDKTLETLGVISDLADQLDRTKTQGSETDAMMKKRFENGEISEKTYQGYIEKTTQTARNSVQDMNHMYDGFFGPMNRSLDNLFGRITGREESLKGSGFGGFATGTSYAPGGMARVGEHGPENVYLPRGAQVTPAYRSGNQGSSGAGGHTVIIQNMNVNNGENPRRIFEEIGFALELAS
ncbi:hypothetical protein HAV21_03555 [Paenarthrobacter sp. MSM-2-10-13]|uniref:hypothetical protein n=1 Tax=Paenarthrobacter sp. MSM-2-10-13 TaxID=2717318 RepID=UPI0014246BBF|nr:hypothetical protein [Paenarthrobacter sp. MSM-2-10-13]NHW45974.1 hypothetical protein [Paenarthrobacter sp. MSM-2-10-13]